MQSDVTIVGGTTPAASLPARPSPEKMASQISTTQPPSDGALPRPSQATQVGVVTEAKIALATKDPPTALSEGERVLKPYGVNMLPDTPTESDETQSQNADDNSPEKPA